MPPPSAGTVVMRAAFERFVRRRMAARIVVTFPLGMHSSVMALSPLTALSPLDGRYHNRVAALRDTFSELALMRLRVRIEIEWLKALAAVILGGLDSIPGAILGGFTIGVLETTVGGYIDAHIIYGFKDIVAFVIILLVLVVKPYGLFGTEHIERL